jgi:hypothetical protein
MSKIWFCSTCGYEVDTKGRCHLCRQKLVASPLPSLPVGDDEAEVGYRIDDWEDGARGRLIEALIAEGILHRFEEDDLVVTTDDEERVDALVEELAEVTGDDGGPFVGGDVDGPPLDAVEDEVVRAVQLLLQAARRLRVDPTDMEADGDVAEASAGVFLTEDYPGAGVDTWAAIGRVTRGLLAALGADEALEDEIRQQAGVLAILLGPLAVDPQPLVEDDGEGPPAAVAGLKGTSGEDEADALDVRAGELGAAELGTAELAASATEDAAAHPAVEAGSDTGDDDTGDVDADDIDTDDGPAERLLGGGPETSYEVPEWLPEQRALLSVLLEDQAIPHAWDGSDLVVASVNEEAAEILFDRIGGVDEDEDEETRYRAIEELFAAVDRLANAPDDDERAAVVVGASGAVEGSTPLGFDDGKWLALRRRTRTLADSIEHGAQPDVVVSQAVSLRDALRELV